MVELRVYRIQQNHLPVHLNLPPIRFLLADLFSAMSAGSIPWRPDGIERDARRSMLTEAAAKTASGMSIPRPETQKKFRLHNSAE